jgi:hypothetical protein
MAPASASAIPDPEKTVVAQAAAAFLTRSGKRISAEYLGGFLHHTADFVTMCEHFDSLGHKYDRGDLARYLLDAVALAKTTQGFNPAVAPPPPPRHGAITPTPPNNAGIQQPAAPAQRAPPSRPARAAPHTVPAVAQIPPTISQGATPTRTASPAIQQAHPFQTNGNPFRFKVKFNAATPIHMQAPAIKQPPTVGSAVKKPSKPQSTVGSANKTSKPHFSTAVPVRQSFVPDSIVIEDSPSPPAPFDDFGYDAMDVDSHTPARDSNKSGDKTVQSISSPFSGPPKGVFPKALAAFESKDEDATKAPLIDLTQNHETTASATESANEVRPKKSAKPKGPLAAKIDKKKAARVSGYDSKNIARNILIIAGKHPTENPLNSHLLPLRENFPGQIDWDSDLSTIRWDILDPEPMAVDNGPANKPNTVGNEPNTVADKSAAVDNEPIAVDNEPMAVDEESISVENEPNTVANKPNTVGNELIAVDNDMDGDDEGDGNVNVSHENPLGLVSAVPKKRARSRKLRQSAPGGLTTISQARAEIAETPKNGRTKHATSTPQTAPHQHAPAPLRTSSDRSRATTFANNPPSAISIESHAKTPKSATMEAETGPFNKRRRTDRPSPAFKKYCCKWEGCSAELHNLDNLKRHIKQHKKKTSTYNNGFPCNWAGCAHPPFASELEWDNHVDAHMEEVKQTFGVGPAALVSGTSPLLRKSRLHPLTLNLKHRSRIRRRLSLRPPGQAGYSHRQDGHR